MANPKTPKLDAVTAEAVDLARTAAEEQAGGFGVGAHLDAIAEDDRVVTHLFECSHPGYPGWRWSVTMVRAARARAATVNEVVLLPSPEALLTPPWVPWAQRIGAGDITPGLLLPTPDNDPRLEPGYTGGEDAADAEPAEWAQTRTVVNELGLGRERVMTSWGRAEAAQRWMAGDPGPNNSASRLAPAPCLTCGFMVRLQGGLGTMFGACANQYSPFDGRVVSFDHGCGGHSDVVADDRGIELPAPILDTIGVDNSLFD